MVKDFTPKPCSGDSENILGLSDEEIIKQEFELLKDGLEEAQEQFKEVQGLNSEACRSYDLELSFNAMNKPYVVILESTQGILYLKNRIIDSVNKGSTRIGIYNSFTEVEAFHNPKQSKKNEQYRKQLQEDIELNGVNQVLINNNITGEELVRLFGEDIDIGELAGFHFNIPIKLEESIRPLIKELINLDYQVEVYNNDEFVSAHFPELNIFANMYKEKNW